MRGDTPRTNTGAPPTELATRAFVGVLHCAATEKLPPFAWTLDLPQQRLLALIADIAPGAARPLSAHRYALLRWQTPPEFRELLALLISAGTTGIAAASTDLAARTVAAACFGSRHLWQDLGLGGRDEVSLLLATCFPPLYRANTRNLKWKRFLFAKLSAHRGNAIYPPNCTRCEDFPMCFPDRTNAADGAPA